LERQIEKEITMQSEMETLLYATSIGRHSAEYWFNNGYKWKNLNSEIIAMRDENGNEIAKSTLRSSYDCRAEGFIGYSTARPPGFYPHPYCANLYYQVNWGSSFNSPYEVICWRVLPV
jgi:hypothetical protein